VELPCVSTLLSEAVYAMSEARSKKSKSSMNSLVITLIANGRSLIGVLTRVPVTLSEAI